MKTRVILVFSVVAVMVLFAIFMQFPAAKFGVLRALLPLTENLSIHSLGGGAYWVEGGISNTGFVVGETGVIAIDAQMFIPTAKKQLAEIAMMTSKPLKTVVLTHSDPDHINGLSAFPIGVDIIAHSEVNQVFEALEKDNSSNGFPPSPEIKNYLPTQTVKETFQTVLDGVQMVFVYTGPAHTSGDLAIYLPAQKLVFAGDLLTPAIGPYPGVHLEKKGSSLGMLVAMKVLLELDAETYVPGHGEPVNKSEFRKILNASELRRNQIKKLFDQGMTLAEIKRSLNDEPLRGLAARFPTFIETTYQELISEKREVSIKRN